MILDIENELTLLEKYKLTPTELFTVKVILLAKGEGDYNTLQRFNNVLEGSFRTVLELLQSKGIILKSYSIPKPGTSFEPEKVEFNKNFVKQFFRASFEMGEELFNVYPQFLTINGICYNARRVSKKFDSLEDAFRSYAKSIKNDPELHQQIIDDIKWAVEDGNFPFTTLDDFIADRAYLALSSFRKGDGININTEAIKMI